MTLETIFAGNIPIYLGMLDDGVPVNIHGPLTALLPAFSKEECRLSLRMVPALIEQNCTSIACVGPFAEILHDEIDDTVSDKGRSDITTTWHTDAEDASEYLVYAAAPLTPVLLALVANHPTLVCAIKQAISDRARDLN